MIMFVMAVLLLIPLAAATEALFASRGQESARSVLAGLAAGAIVWNAHIYLAAFPWLSAVLAGISVVIVLWTSWRLGHPARVAASAAAAVASLVLLWDVALLGVVNREGPPSFAAAASTSPRRALIVYHPGGSAFPGLIAQEAARGLTAKGWSVDRATTTSTSPLPNQAYGLLVVVTPTYNWGEAANPVRRYIARLAPLDGLPVAGLTTGAGWAPEREVDQLLVDKGGRLVASGAIFTTAPNIIAGAPVTAAEAALRFGVDAARSIDERR
jgi:hypothetical protein